MKMAMIGSYGHVNLVLDHLQFAPAVKLVAAAPYGPDDPLAFTAHPAAAGIETFDDYRAMLDAVKPDLVSVNLPLYRNAAVSAEAARRGIHVFSEKPLATTLDDLAALRAAAKQTGAQLTTMLEFRGHPAFAAVHDCIASGRIGEPLLATAQKSYPFGTRDEYYAQRATYGGSLPWIAIHAVDYTYYCCGKRFSHVSAFQHAGAHADRPEMEDSGGLLLGLAGGGQAVITFDFLRPWGKHDLPWGDDRLRIAGSEAVVETLDHGRQASLLTPSGHEDLPLGEPVSLFGSFVKSLAGRGPCLVPPDDAFYVTEVCLRARDAADSGTVVSLL